MAALVFVAAWLFSTALQRLIPFWIPFALLLAAELELAVRAWRELRQGTPTTPPEHLLERRLPGADDADLGWGEIVEDGEGGVVWTPPPRRQPRRGRRSTTIATAAALLVLFVLAARTDREHTWAGLSEKSRARAEQRFTTEATRIAGRHVTVLCDDSYQYTGIGSDALGVAFIQRGLAFLDPAACRDLHDLVFHDQGAQREATAEAILVLAHEAVHLAGVRDEGLTECRALQQGVKLGVRLGLGESRAHAAMRSLYFRSLAERSITRLSYRLPEGCVDGGRLDVRPADHRFPEGRSSPPCRPQPACVSHRSSIERRLDAPAGERNACRAEILAEHGCGERVGFRHDPLSLGLERAAGDEERRACAPAPVVDLLERRTGIALAGVGNARCVA